MNTETLTDTLIDFAFDEMECIAAADKRPHEGDKAAYYIGHGCWPDGFLCTAHFRSHLEVRRPKLLDQLAYYGSLLCAGCRERFYDIDSFCKVVPL